MAHSDEIRAQVQAALLAGQGVSEVARAYKLPRQTVSRIKGQLQKTGQNGTEKRERLGSLLCHYLQANLNALAEQAKIAGDPSYVRRQPAAELATLHGVMADKAARLLEAAQSMEEAAPEPEGEG